MKRIATEWSGSKTAHFAADGDHEWRVRDGIGGIELRLMVFEGEGEAADRHVAAVLKSGTSHWHKLPALAERMRAAAVVLLG